MVKWKIANIKIKITRLHQVYEKTPINDVEI